MEAADVATRFFTLVRAGATRHRGSVVKFLGDGVMLHFPDPDDAIAGAHELVREVKAAGLPPARAGLAAGTLVFRDGDYFGRTVNLAARIADDARPLEVLISAEAAAGATPTNLRLTEVGSVSLKGTAEPIALYSVQGI